MSDSDPALIAAYQMLLDQDPEFASLVQALGRQDYVVLSRATYNYLWSNQIGINGPTETTKAKARSRKSNAAKAKGKTKTKTKRGEE